MVKHENNITWYAFSQHFRQYQKCFLKEKPNCNASDRVNPKAPTGI